MSSVHIAHKRRGGGLLTISHVDFIWEDHTTAHALTVNHAVHGSALLCNVHIPESASEKTAK